MSVPKQVTSFGPAGSKLDVREAGENILNNFCHHYPDTEVHSIIPNFFSGKFTELMEPRPNLTRKEEDQLRGRTINQVGESHENVVFNMFLRLIRQKDISPTLLVMRMFEMDTDNGVGLKRMALMSQLPNLNLKSTNTSAENDFVVLVKDCGVVFVEVKGSTNENNVRSAEKQLTNVNAIVQCVIKAITGSKDRILPTIKLIVVPDCTNPSPKGKTHLGSYFLFNDSCENFREKWLDIISKLSQLKLSYPFTSDEFKELSKILVGIWSAKVVCATDKGLRKHELKQDEADLSYIEQLKKLDDVVDTGNIRDESQFRYSEDKLNPFTNIIRTNELDIFRSCNDIKLCYLTPAQKEVFSFHKQAIIRGSAGCGKSLLLLFKVLEVLNNAQSSSRVLILVPVPHNIRIYNSLLSNSVSVEMISSFPPLQSASDVFLMDIEKFFKVSHTDLMDYNMTDYHLFVDDVQYMYFPDPAFGDRKHTLYHHVGDFIEQAYKVCVQQNTYCWVMVDVMQGSIRRGGVGGSSEFLFLDRYDVNKTRTYTIPIIHLSHVMRNTSEIIRFTNEARGEFVNQFNASSLTLPSPEVGHNVTSRIPVYHKLQRIADDKQTLSFITARVHEELKVVTTPPFSFQLSNIAIIWDEEAYNKYKDEFSIFLGAEFSTTPQTIEEQLISSNTKDIIMDIQQHIMSYEAPVVVFICFSHNSRNNGDIFYKICSRGRVSLAVVDVNPYSGPATFKNMDTVLWKPDNNSFVRYTCTCENEDLVPCMC